MSELAEPRTRRKQREPMPLPFTILIDHREITGGMAWLFTGINDEKGNPLAVPYEVKTMKTADYSIVGMEDKILIERKSLSDALGSCGGGRVNFQKEHERMAAVVKSGGYACVIVEADWRAILNIPRGKSKMNPYSVFGTAMSWSIRYQVPWMACHSRRFAEITAFNILARFFDQQQTQSGAK